jgi:serine/threonine protein kinase
MNYITPEMASSNQSSAEPAMDVWTLGVMLYLMKFGSFPFKDDKNGSIEENVMNRSVEFPSDVWISPECCDFIKCCLIKDPKCRITPSAMLIHDWMLMSDDALDEMEEKKQF